MRERSSPLAFFALSYAITWVLLTPFVYLWNTTWGGDFPAWALIFLPGAYGPSIAALILAAREGGRARVVKLLRGLFAWRAPLAAYAVVFALPIAIVFGAVLLSSYRETALQELTWGPAIQILPLAFLAALPFGPLGEELGWRGYALPLLLERHNAWVASLVLGGAWTFWHLPLYWLPGASIPSFLDPSPMSVALYLGQITGETLIITAVFLWTRGSVFIAVLFHMTFNTAETIFFRGLPDPAPEESLEIYLWTIGLTGVAAVIALSVTRTVPGTEFSSAAR